MSLHTALLAQSIVLFHYGLDIDGYNPIHKYRWRPLPVVAAWSRTARLQPQVKVEDTIFCWFRAPGPERFRSPCMFLVGVSGCFREWSFFLVDPYDEHFPV